MYSIQEIEAKRAGDPVIRKPIKDEAEVAGKETDEAMLPTPGPMQTGDFKAGKCPTMAGN